MSALNNLSEVVAELEDQSDTLRQIHDTVLDLDNQYGSLTVVNQSLVRDTLRQWIDEKEKSA